jgi:FkbM family methyltransferase
MTARVRLALIVVVSGILMASSAVVALRIGQEWGRLMVLNEATFAGARDASAFDALSRPRKAAVAIRAAFDQGGYYHGAYNQDRWIASVVFPHVRDGFYVDVGAGDGIRQSNTKTLDDLGWEGIAVDPFPTNMETRTARVVRAVVSSSSGQKVLFKASKFAGGIEALLGATKGWDVHKTADSVELTTTTLDDILAKAGAPTYIHYLSLDIEGAEFEALKGLSLGKYRFGAMTIEHNWEEPKRSQIRELLQAAGYRNLFALIRDDFYIHSSLWGAAALRDADDH